MFQGWPIASTLSLSMLACRQTETEANSTFQRVTKRSFKNNNNVLEQKQEQGITRA